MSVDKEELGNRIRKAREAVGLTQEQLSQATELSRVAISQIEAGNRSVSSIELYKIAHAVGQDITAFFVKKFAPQDALSALFRAEPALAQDPELLEAVRISAAMGREMTNLEKLLGIDQTQPHIAKYEFPTTQSRWDAITQGQKIALDERQRLGLGISPIGDLVELLESEGIRIGLVDLPTNVSGLTLFDDNVHTFVVINRTHPTVRRRFSLAHEYAHVLIDRGRASAISRTENRTDLLEIRANAFAAEFLMPAEGVSQFMQGLGKGRMSRSQVAVFDETDVVQAEQRTPPGSQAIQIHDVILLAHHFGVSRIATLYQLKNLKMIDEKEFKNLKSQEESGAGKAIAQFLNAEDPKEEQAMLDQPKRRFLRLALEASRREEITFNKLAELAAMVGVKRQEVQQAITSAGFEM